MRLASHDARWWLGRLFWLVGALLVLATLIPIIDSNYWWVRNLTFPQIQITIAIGIVIVLTVVLLDLRRTAVRVLLAGLSASLVYQLFYLAPYTRLARTTVADAAACPAGRSFSLIEANVRAGNTDHAPILKLVRQRDPDLFFAVETDNQWQRALAPLRARYPYVIVAPRNDYWAMMLFSKLPLDDGQVRHLVEGYVPSIRATVILPSGERFVFHGQHPKPPMMHGSAQGDAEVVQVAREVAQAGQPAIVTGDFNDVPWSSTTQLFQKLGGLEDPRVGRGFIPSFDANSSLMRWPLDHVFVTPGFQVQAFDRLPDIGSDHFPMAATLCLAQPLGPDPTHATSVWQRARQVVLTGESR